MKQFIYTFLKSLNPRYYPDLGEKSLNQAFRYFFVMLILAFVIMAFTAVPKMILIKQKIDKSVMDIKTLKLDATLETVAPIKLPDSHPLVTLDTTNNRTWEDEVIFITDKQFKYNFLGNKKEIDLNGYNIENDRKMANRTLLSIFLFLLPSLFFFYFMAYLIKYLVIIVGTAIAGFVLAKLFRNSISLIQSVILSFYVSTYMVIIEIITIPLPIKDYLLTYSLLGFNTSIIAITVYLTFYVTAIRINGSTKIK
jgi:hypothetical protein